MSPVNDFKFPGTRGERPADSDKAMKYGAAMQRLAVRDPAIHKLIFEVHHLLKPRSAFRHPAVWGTASGLPSSVGATLRVPRKESRDRSPDGKYCDEAGQLHGHHEARIDVAQCRDDRRPVHTSWARRQIRGQGIHTGGDDEHSADARANCHQGE